MVAVLRARGRNLTFSYPLFAIKEYTGVSRNTESDESVNADRATPKGIMGSVSLLFDRSYQCFMDSAFFAIGHHEPVNQGERPLLMTPCGIVVYPFIGQCFPKKFLLSGEG